MRAGCTLSILLALLSAGCGSEPNRPWGDNAPMPPPHYDIQLDVELSSADGAPGQPITVTAKAHNEGNRRVQSFPTNSCGPDIELRVLDAAGQLVFLKNPCDPVPICLRDGPVNLDPGHFIEVPLDFTGQVFRLLQPTPPYECTIDQAPEGDYLVVAQFRYAPVMGEIQVLEKRVPFHWSAQ